MTHTDDRVGGAGLVVRNLCELGAKVTMIGVVGMDAEGEIIRAYLDANGVATQGVIASEQHPTIIKTRVVAQSQQIVRIDKENLAPLSEVSQLELATLLERELERSDAIIISDYGKGVVSNPMMAILAEAARQGITGISKKPVVLDPHPRNTHLYFNGGISVAKPNRHEAEQATGLKLSNNEEFISAARTLLGLWRLQMALITLGEDGLVIVQNEPNKPEEVHRLPAQALSVFDVSGAGDAVTATFTALLAAGASAEMAGCIANLAAGMVVAEVGTVPIRLDLLMQEVEAFYLL
jgi:D-beta-D-heptose 7-phosphate kinase/D-beta-D-heptose 1-phosphate adenosyltransferase